MSMDSATAAGIPSAVERVLTDLTAAAQTSFQDDLSCLLLFGSAAEGRLRATSDLNLLVVLKRFQPDRANAFREPMRLARVAARATAMFALESELPTAAEMFAVKFADIARRSRVLFGQMPSSLRAIPPDVLKRQLRQLLMNLTLRLRNGYVMTSLREEQLALLIADSTGPLRAAAATLLQLEGRRVASPKESLRTVADSLDGEDWNNMLQRISEARQSRRLPPGVAGPIVFRMMALADAMRFRAERLD